MTAPATPHTLGAVVRCFLTAVVAIGLLADITATASATTSTAAQNAVGDQTPALAPLVGPGMDVSPPTHPDSTNPQPKTVVATAVATKSVDDVTNVLDVSPLWWTLGVGLRPNSGRIVAGRPIESSPAEPGLTERLPPE
ncbi:hypothetical protein [Demequina sp.]|uniref:hypothetical protein n=1 Tax=Demequina sp. TaxID=2050685 RepID=UPI003D0D93EC